METPLWYTIFLQFIVVQHVALFAHGQIHSRSNWTSDDCPKSYDGPWGQGIQCPCENPPFPNGTKTYTGFVPASMTNDAVNYLRNTNVTMFEISTMKTYSELANLYFVMRKEFHIWHYVNGKKLTGCWKGVTVYQYIQA